jgi:hypothetical protein
MHPRAALIFHQLPTNWRQQSKASISTWHRKNPSSYIANFFQILFQEFKDLRHYFLSQATPRQLFVATPRPQISKDDSGNIHCDNSQNKGFSQRSNIFHTTCRIKKKVCAVVIDSGSFENFVTEALVRHLNLKTKKHPSPYYLSWLRLGTEVLVTETCHVPISLGKSYKTKVVCHVVNMDFCDVILGRPWQYDVDATHRGRKNAYVFSWKGKKIVVTAKMGLPNPFAAESQASCHCFDLFFTLFFLGIFCFMFGINKLYETFS